MPAVTLDDIYRARERLLGVIQRTPVVRVFIPDIPGGNTLWLKAENLQRTGSFKLRGAYNAIAGLSQQERRQGVITYSSGNHGQAVACAARLLGVQAVVVMPEDAISLKVEATRRWGAQVEFAGHTSLDRQKRAMDLVARHGYAVIPPFDDPRIIAGQGTLGVELVEQLPDVEAIVIQVGGGGLISGVSTAVKALRPDVRVIGVEPKGAADAQDSFRSGRLVTWERIDTVADGLRTSRVGELNFDAIRANVDEIVTVSDDEIVRAVGLLAGEVHLVTEPSGATAPAAVLFGRIGVSDTRVLAVISGGNIAPTLLQSSLDRVGAEQASTPV